MSLLLLDISYSGLKLNWIEVRERLCHLKKMEKEYDIIVVGAGLIGSAAARHLVEISKNRKVLLIGPEEPKVSNSVEKIFLTGAHGARDNY